MNDREQRGPALAVRYRIEMVGGKWLVPSQTGDGHKYEVDPEKRHCTCRDYGDRSIKCKHMFAVEFVQTRDRGDNGTETVTRTFKVTERVTYRQDSASYNKAQAGENRHFANLEAIAGVGAVPYVASKDNATGAVGSVFAKAFHYFRFKRDDFLAHYHRAIAPR